MLPQKINLRPLPEIRNRSLPINKRISVPPNIRDRCADKSGVVDHIEVAIVYLPRLAGIYRATIDCIWGVLQNTVRVGDSRPIDRTKRLSSRLRDGISCERNEHATSHKKSSPAEDAARPLF